MGTIQSDRWHCLSCFWLPTQIITERASPVFTINAPLHIPSAYQLVAMGNIPSCWQLLNSVSSILLILFLGALFIWAWERGNGSESLLNLQAGWPVILWLQRQPSLRAGVSGWIFCFSPPWLNSFRNYTIYLFLYQCLYLNLYQSIAISITILYIYTIYLYYLCLCLYLYI